VPTLLKNGTEEKKGESVSLRLRGVISIDKEKKKKGDTT